MRLERKFLKEGGNAVDSAVASALVLGVTESQASGLGGQTMALIRKGDDVIAVDGSSRAPSLAHVSSVYQQDRSTGYRATTVPSTPATLWYIHDRYGALPLQQVVEPAISIAESGFPITELQNKLQMREVENFNKVESRSGIHYFFDDGKPFEAGKIFKQPDLARTLKRFSDKGVEEFYRGKTAHMIDADMRENGGLPKEG